MPRFVQAFLPSKGVKMGKRKAPPPCGPVSPGSVHAFFGIKTEVPDDDLAVPPPLEPQPGTVMTYERLASIAPPRGENRIAPKVQSLMTACGSNDPHGSAEVAVPEAPAEALELEPEPPVLDLEIEPPAAPEEAQAPEQVLAASAVVAMPSNTV